MKKLLTILIIILINFCARAQLQTNPSIGDNQIVTYRLFSTTNIWNFIKLDTRNGQLWQVQWSTGDNRFVSDLSVVSQVTKEDEKIGRFTLQATQNINTFLLLDQIDGRVWQVQWSVDHEKRGIIRIY
ncbi:hypothetical protein [Chryseobacterium sediminis]|uniref:hypothetical protein n=1 Tax=Chryseobacterium sediminis TaxID=1679494 RepID=UPI0028671FF7|nr:hypothetical protein [Chryseobacterium sediminis]MDR6464568.1 hypothetical protein [Chryseobacterium sediminis]